MATIANINGTNITRLRILQMGTNTSRCMLSQAPIEDAQLNGYMCGVENLMISTDIPIFKSGTLVFVVFPLDEIEEDDRLFDPYEGGSKYKCIVGPVYSFLDFLQQIETFCKRYNADNTTVGLCHVDSQLATQKHLGIRGTHAFWSSHILLFPNEIGRIFEDIEGGEDTYHTYLNRGILAKTSILHIPPIQPIDLRWSTDLDAYLYLDDPWLLGQSAVVSMKCKLDMFENRFGLVVDAVLPLAFEMFCLNSNKHERNKGSNKFSFLTLDFPEGNLSHRTIMNHTISDDIEISQRLRTGLFKIVTESVNSISKKLLPGTIQDQRFELLLVRKVSKADGTVQLVEEPVEFSSGDFWSMDIVFTKQV
jgi:hypothetical protein